MAFYSIELGVFLILALCSLCQAIFGMGLLVFGTPALLLFDYTFEEALWILLPASFTVSTLQLLEGASVSSEFKQAFFLYCLPPTFLSLSVYLAFSPEIAMNVIVGTAMMTFCIIRLQPAKILEVLTHQARGNIKTVMALMGFVHGISNMGGGILSILAATYFKEKLEIRSAIVFCYWFLGLLQILTLSIFSSKGVNWLAISFTPIVVLIYFCFGRYSFISLGEQTFQRLLTIFIFCCSVALLLK